MRFCINFIWLLFHLTFVNYHKSWFFSFCFQDLALYFFSSKRRRLVANHCYSLLLGPEETMENFTVSVVTIKQTHHIELEPSTFSLFYWRVAIRALTTRPLVVINALQFWLWWYDGLGDLSCYLSQWRLGYKFWRENFAVLSLSNEESCLPPKTEEGFYSVLLYLGCFNCYIFVLKYKN